MKIFIINLARSVERRKSMAQQLSALNLNYEFIDAIDGKKLTHDEILQNTKPISYAVTCGEIGCSLSHIKIYKKIKSENIPIALILEDDALLSPETVSALSEIEELNLKNPTITLLTEDPKYIGSPLHNSRFKNHKIFKVLEGACSHGYIINNSAACKMVDFLYPVWMVADKWQLLNEYSVCNVEAVVPPVIGKTPCADSSTIQIESTLKRRIEEQKKLMWAEIKKRRSHTLKIKRLLWSSFIYPFLNINR
ncbi:glycosyltransferase family 25 protein [Pantoea deleyi]|uniref:glycosyltransferase family 25 protein n=1 Tax=Pantoea deleyi TaxID=470932 RepID=UPI0035D4B67D